MEARAPYHTAAPQKGPRNLAAAVAACLRALGFTATEYEQTHYATVAAHWLDESGARFELSYKWAAGPVPEATCSLQVLYARSAPEVLFTAQKVRRLQDLRLLLLGNVRYHNARLLSRPAAPAPSAP